MRNCAFLTRLHATPENPEKTARNTRLIFNARIRKEKNRQKKIYNQDRAFQTGDYVMWDTTRLSNRDNLVPRGRKLLPSPLLEGVGSVRLVTAVVEAALVSQGREGVPGRFPSVSRVSRVYRTRSAGAEGRAAGLPSVGMPEPLSARGFPDAAGTSASTSQRLLIQDCEVMCYN